MAARGPAPVVLEPLERTRGFRGGRRGLGAARRGSLSALVARLFRPLPTRERDHLARLARDTSRFLLEEVGHARLLGLDSDEKIRKRARPAVEI